MIATTTHRLERIASRAEVRRAIDHARKAVVHGESGECLRTAPIGLSLVVGDPHRRLIGRLAGSVSRHLAHRALVPLVHRPAPVDADDPTVST